MRKVRVTHNLSLFSRTPLASRGTPDPLRTHAHASTKETTSVATHLARPTALHAGFQRQPSARPHRPFQLGLTAHSPWRGYTHRPYTRYDTLTV